MSRVSTNQFPVGNLLSDLLIDSEFFSLMSRGRTAFPKLSLYNQLMLPRFATRAELKEQIELVLCEGIGRSTKVLRQR